MVALIVAILVIFVVLGFHVPQIHVKDQRFWRLTSHAHLLDWSINAFLLDSNPVYISSDNQIPRNKSRFENGLHFSLHIRG